MNHTETTKSGLTVHRFSFQSAEEAYRVGSSVMADPLRPLSAGKVVARKRLYGPDPQLDELIWPVRKYWGGQSWEDSWCLYWLPLAFSNRSDTQLDPRFAKFMDLLLVRYLQNSRLSKLTFFDSELIHPHLVQHFALHAMDYFPLPTIGFCPDEGACHLPQPDELSKIDPHDTFRLLQEKQQSFRMRDLFPRSPRILSCLMGSQDLARKTLTGRGGYSFVASPLTQSAFFSKAKEMLARNTESEILRRIPVVAPILSVASFTRSLHAECAAWFGMFDLYITESLTDRGVVIAANGSLDEALPDLVKQSDLKELGRRSRFGLRVKDPKW